MLPDSGEVHLPEPPVEEPAPVVGDVPPSDERSLLDDIEDLLLDAKTYIDAELTYQKTRARFITDRIKKAAVFAVAAAFIAVLALIGLTIGAILSLATVIGPLAATVVVVGVMFLAVYLLLKRAGRFWGEMMDAMQEDGSDDGATQAGEEQS